MKGRSLNDWKKVINNLFSYYGMHLAAVQQKLMEFNGEDAEKYKELILNESYFQGILDTLEAILSLIEQESAKVGEADNSKYL